VKHYVLKVTVKHVLRVTVKHYVLRVTVKHYVLRVTVKHYVLPLEFQHNGMSSIKTKTKLTHYLIPSKRERCHTKQI